jgi:hypothetical protein
MNLHHVRVTVASKLLDQNPELYRRLENAQELNDFLDDTSERIKDQVTEDVLAAGNRPEFAKASAHLSRLQAMEAAGRETLNALLSELEFPMDDPEPTDSEAPTSLATLQDSGFHRTVDSGGRSSSRPSATPGGLKKYTDELAAAMVKNLRARSLEAGRKDASNAQPSEPFDEDLGG